MAKQSRDKVRAEVASDKTRTQLVRTARRVLSPEDSEDAAHDAVVQALVHADEFRADAQVGTWLYRIAFNAALVHQRCAHRATQRLLRVEREGLPGVGPADAGAAPATVLTLEEIELRQQLRAAVDKLPAAYRAAIQRCVYDEQEPERVAVELGITPSALRTRITRARDQLRELLSEAPAAPAAAVAVRRSATRARRADRVQGLRAA